MSQRECDHLPLLAGLWKRLTYFKSFAGSQNQTLISPSWAHLCHLLPGQQCLDQGHFCPPKGTLANVCRHFWLSQMKWETENATNIFQMQKTASHYQGWHGWNGTRVEAEKPCASQTTLVFSKHARLSHRLLGLNTACFLHLDCPALLLCPRNDHLSSVIHSKCQLLYTVLSRSPKVGCSFWASRAFCAYLVKALATWP